RFADRRSDRDGRQDRGDLRDAPALRGKRARAHGPGRDEPRRDERRHNRDGRRRPPPLPQRRGGQGPGGEPAVTKIRTASGPSSALPTAGPNVAANLRSPKEIDAFAEISSTQTPTSQKPRFWRKNHRLEAESYTGNAFSVTVRVSGDGQPFVDRDLARSV